MDIFVSGTAPNLVAVGTLTARLSSQFPKFQKLSSKALYETYWTLDTLRCTLDGENCFLICSDVSVSSGRKIPNFYVARFFTYLKDPK